MYLSDLKFERYLSKTPKKLIKVCTYAEIVIHLNLEISYAELMSNE